MNRSTRIRATTDPGLSRRRVLQAAFGSLALTGACTSAGVLLPSTARSQQAGRITATSLGELRLIQGTGCNVLAMPGQDGALMIDGGRGANAEALIRAVLDATGNDRVALLINTHWHPDQTGANVAVGESGATIFAHENTRLYLANRIHTSSAFEGELDPLPAAGQPTETTRDEGSLDFSGTRIDYGHLPQAHTDGDLYLHFPSLNTLAAGGVVSAERWPLLDYHNGAWFGGRVRALEWLAELVEPDTRVVPADGPLLDGRAIVRQRDIYLELFDTLIGYMNRGFGPEDAAAANPLEAYEPEFGDASEFTYGAYRSMLIAYVPE